MGGGERQRELKSSRDRPKARLAERVLEARCEQLRMRARKIVRRTEEKKGKVKKRRKKDRGGEEERTPAHVPPVYIMRNRVI